MTACSRRNFVSGMGALILTTGTSVTLSAQVGSNDKQKPIRYAMLHDETSCIGCTACMDACRPTKCRKGFRVWKLSVVSLMANFRMRNMSFSANPVNIVPMHLVYRFVRQVPRLLMHQRGLSMFIKICVSAANTVSPFVLTVCASFIRYIKRRINVISVAIPIWRKVNSLLVLKPVQLMH